MGKQVRSKQLFPRDQREDGGKEGSYLGGPSPAARGGKTSRAVMWVGRGLLSATVKGKRWCSKGDGLGKSSSEKYPPVMGDVRGMRRSR